MKFEFIHCGDLHLGCFPNRLEERFLDFFDRFDEMIDYAITHGIEWMLISGDFFHLKVINAKTMQKTLELLQKAKDHHITIVVIEGNHDKAFFVDEDSWLTFLHAQSYIILLESVVENGLLMTSPYENKSGAILELKDVRIIGISYLGGTTEKYIKEWTNRLDTSDKFSILMLHAAIDRLSGQEMGDIKGNIIKDLQGKIDYVALGHIHTQYEYEAFCYNPGSLENVHVRDKEKNVKGFYHVVVQDTSKTVTHIASKPRKIVFAHFDVTGMSTPKEVEEHILSQTIVVQPREMMQMTLTGKVTFNPFLIDIKSVYDELMNRYNLLHLDIQNHINASKLSSNQTDAMDMSTIVFNIIKDEISYNDPKEQHVDAIAQDMIEITDRLNSGMDYDSILESLYKKDVRK